MTFLTQYNAVFAAVKAAVQTKASIKTVILGEQFVLGDLPKAIINAAQAPISQFDMTQLSVKINFNIILVIRDYAPQDWFTDIIPIMADAMDAILADRSLAGSCFNCTPTGFYPGEIKFDDKVLFGGQLSFIAEVLVEA